MEAIEPRADEDEEYGADPQDEQRGPHRSDHAFVERLDPNHFLRVAEAAGAEDRRHFIRSLLRIDSRTKSGHGRARGARREPGGAARGSAPGQQHSEARGREHKAGGHDSQDAERTPVDLDAGVFEGVRVGKDGGRQLVTQDGRVGGGRHGAAFVRGAGALVVL